MASTGKFGARLALPAIGAGTWQLGVCIAMASACAFLLYADTFASMVSVWQRSNTYVHGFLILPISVFVILQQRRRVRWSAVRPSPAGFAVLFLAVFLWLLSTEAHVQVGRHLAFIGILAAAFWAVLGTAAASRLRFPLVFAFFAAPFGDFLIPPLMIWTAKFTVWAINATGIPVYLEGYYFSLPSGNFEVIEACSGIRYLLVTVVLAIFFAYERYRSQLRRVAFVVGATAAIIVANGLRAYLIVLVAHASDMRYGTGQDHIYFGWVFFALSILAIFWVGNRFSDRPASGGPAAAAPAKSIGAQTVRRTGFAALAAIGLMALGPVAVQAVRALPAEALPHALLPAAAASWQGPAPLELAYRPEFSGDFEAVQGSYGRDGATVDVHGVLFTRQSQGSELVGQGSRLFDPERWRVAARVANTTVAFDGGRIDVKRLVLTDGRRNVLLWYWYDIGGWRTTSAVATKIYHALQSLSGRDTGDGMFVLATPVASAGDEAAADRLREFLSGHLDTLGRCLRAPSAEGAGCVARE